MDDATANAAFRKKYDFPFPLLCDTDRAVALAYGAAEDANAQYARRVGVIIGGDGNILAYEPKADARNWSGQALAALGG